MPGGSAQEDQLTSMGGVLTLRNGLLLLTIGMMAAGLFGLGHPPEAQAQGERLVLAFYYPWFDKNAWNSGTMPDLPEVPYNSDHPEAMIRHIEQAKGAGIDAFVLNWWGQGSRTEKNLKALLDLSAERGFRVAVDFDLNSPVMQGSASYVTNLRHLLQVHAAHPAYLRVGGRPVVFFYNVSRLSVDAWRSIRDQADPSRQALWIAEGTNINYQAVFDGHHLYSITWPNRIPPANTLSSWASRVQKYNQQHGADKIWVATVMPGYDDRKARPGSGFARSRDDGAYYRACWQAAIASQPQWVVINSFNEWPEGSYIEPSKAYGHYYLDLTRELAAQFKGASFTAQAAPPMPTAAPPTAIPQPPTPIPPTPTPQAWPTIIRDTSTPSQIKPPCGYLLSTKGQNPVWEMHCRGRTDLTRPFPLMY